MLTWLLRERVRVYFFRRLYLQYLMKSLVGFIHVLSFSVSRRDSRFLSRSALSSRRARNSENATKGLCAALVCHHAKFRAQTCIARWGVVFRARVLAHTLLCVFLFVTSTTVVLPYEGKLFMCTRTRTPTVRFFADFFRITTRNVVYVEDYLLAKK